MEDRPYIIREFDKCCSITDIIRAQNLALINKVLEQKIIEANSYIATQLELPLASKLFYLKRLRSVEGEPRSVENNYFNLDEVRGMETIDFNNISFFSEVYKHKGIRKLRSEQEILIVEADDEERKLLQLNENDQEIMLIKGVSIKEDNRPFEYFEISSDLEFYRFRSASRL